MSKENITIVSDGSPIDKYVTRWGTVAQAADRYQVSQKTIRRMISRGEIEAARFGPRLMRVDMNSVDQMAHRL